ncbi:DUF4253 domain-containing protein [Streptomyces roseirectus]|uniref:DUF4253 domain-containing protein n=1 Tax=Streptomyces roseirectus TaxID=2768066 RepID=A0A7H0IDU5_9ACTN|nr:DUF4253 domain-containing protein [Streptomyces roseirectus]QNP70961.1 DUF4253 domain-containing protein [Streptomyces roseirectus]
MATLPNPLPHLTTDPSGRSLGLRLPPGKLVDRDWPEPLLWYADQPSSSGNWTALGARAGQAGLLPVLVDVDKYWVDREGWELDPDAMSYPGDHDAEEVLAESWEMDEEDYDDDTADMLAPFTLAWPGLAPSATPTVDPDARAAQLADEISESDDTTWFTEPHLALVPARRSADIPAAIGWTGPLNHENDVARLCAVLRSWEDRFGARVVALGFATLAVSVAAPPTTQSEAEAIAAEHYAFCPDNIAQGPGTIEAYAKELIDAHAWHFWWD